MTPDQIVRKGAETSLRPTTSPIMVEVGLQITPNDQWSFLDVVPNKTQPLSPDAIVATQIKLAQRKIEEEILEKIRKEKIVDQVYSAGMVCCGGHGSFSAAMEVAHLPHAETHCKRCGKTTCHEFGKCKECKTRGII